MEFFANKKKAFVISTIIVLLAISWLELLDNQAGDYLRQVMFEAMAAFGIAKVINAVVSVLQSFEVGIGVASITLGEALDPMNDLVEMYASLMQLSIGSLIVQNLLLDIVSSLFFKLFITIAGIALTVRLYRHGFQQSLGFFRFFLFAVFLRFAILLAVATSFFVDQLIVEQRLNRSVEKMEAFSQRIDLNDSQSSISQELKASLTNDLSQLKQHKDELLEKLSALGWQLAKQDIRISNSEQALKAKQQSMGTLERLWNNDQEYKTLLQQLVQEQDQRDSLLRQQRALTEQLNTSRDRIEISQNILQGKPNGFIERLKQGFSSFSEGFASIKTKLDELINSFDDIMADLMYIMSAFVFRTLIMPLIFFYGFMKGFAFIWSIPPQNLWPKWPSAAEKADK